MQRRQQGLFEDFDYYGFHKFGKLTLTGVNFVRISPGGYKTRTVVAECECGVVDSYYFSSLLSGQVICCGCTKTKRKNLTTSQEHSKHPLYTVYMGVKQRCCNPKCKNYKHYGARGIAICDEWLNDYFSFYNWCITHGWEKGLDLDREDNNGHYCPENCRFVTRPISLRNYSRNVNIEAWGETKCLSDWALDKRCGTTYPGLRHRYERGKWDTMEQMISNSREELKQRVRKDSRMITGFGQCKNLSQWLQDPRCLVKRDSLRDRLNAGWSAEKALGTLPSRDGKNSK